MRCQSINKVRILTEQNLKFSAYTVAVENLPDKEAVLLSALLRLTTPPKRALLSHFFVFNINIGFGTEYLSLVMFSVLKHSTNRSTEPFIAVAK